MGSDSNVFSPCPFGIRGGPIFLLLLVPGYLNMPRWLSESCQALCAALVPSLNISSKIPAEWASVSCQDPDWYNFSSEIQNSGIKFQKLVWLRAHFEKTLTSSQKNSSYPGLISWCPQQISAVWLRALDTDQGARGPALGNVWHFWASVPGATLFLYFHGTDHSGSWKKILSN